MNCAYLQMYMSPPHTGLSRSGRLRRFLNDAVLAEKYLRGVGSI